MSRPGMGEVRVRKFQLETCGVADSCLSPSRFSTICEVKGAHSSAHEAVKIGISSRSSSPTIFEHLINNKDLFEDDEHDIVYRPTFEGSYQARKTVTLKLHR